MTETPVPDEQWPWPDTLDACVAAPQSHRLLFENEVVRVLEVSIEPGTREPVRTHRAPSVMIVDGPARIRYYTGTSLTFQTPTDARHERRTLWLVAAPGGPGGQGGADDLGGVSQPGLAPRRQQHLADPARGAPGPPRPYPADAAPRPRTRRDRAQAHGRSGRAVAVRTGDRPNSTPSSATGFLAKVMTSTKPGSARNASLTSMTDQGVHVLIQGAREQLDASDPALRPGCVLLSVFPLARPLSSPLSATASTTSASPSRAADSDMTSAPSTTSHPPRAAQLDTHLPRDGLPDHASVLAIRPGRGSSMTSTPPSAHPATSWPYRHYSISAGRGPVQRRAHRSGRHHRTQPASDRSSSADGSRTRYGL
jgi:hypothetical protein